MADRKRVAVIVEWDGACPEDVWAGELLVMARKAFESDKGRDTHCRAMGAVALTNYGTTPELSDAESDAALGSMEAARKAGVSVWSWLWPW